MDRVCDNVTQLIGRTPLVRLTRLSRQYGCLTDIIAKVESLNPGGSVKDRAALYMLNSAFERGELSRQSVVIEPTSGNMGVALSMICASMGLRAVIVMPDTMSAERVALMRAYGATVVLTPPQEGMAGAIAEAKRLCAQTPHAYMPMQFENDDNCQSHRDTTVRELFDALDSIDCLIAGVGTGGTVTGCGEGVKRRCPDCRVVAVEPFDAPVLSGGFAQVHELQGIGAGFVPPILNSYILDEVMKVRTGDAFELARALAKTEGLLCGISSGAALAAAVAVARRPQMAGQTLVVILPDTGERYLSSGLFK